MNKDNHIVLRTSAVSFGKSHRELKASLRPGGEAPWPATVPPPEIEITRLTWRPLVGPAKDIPIKLSAGGNYHPDDPVALAAADLEKQRQAWRPVMGPAGGD